jgi:hypothetical protein
VSVDARDGYTADARDEMQNAKVKMQDSVCILHFAF